MATLYRHKKRILYWLAIMAILGIISSGVAYQQGPSNIKAEQIQESPNREVDSFPEQGKMYHIGILQFTEHPALDAVHSGILDVLEAAGLMPGKNITIEYHNSKGDSQKCRVAIEAFVKGQMDLIVAIATPSAQAAVEQKDIPVLFAAVTEPEKAGLVETWQKPNTNATGVSDLNPVEALLDMTMEIVPDAKTIGVVYNPAEINSVVQVELSQQIADELGIKIIKAKATNPAKVGVMAQELVNKVDVIWVPTDNTVLSAFHELIEVTNKHNVPVVGASVEFAMQGALCATGYDYYVLGLQAGEMAIELIRGTDPGTMPVQIATEIQIAVNMQSAEAIGYRIPFEVLVIADHIF